MEQQLIVDVFSQAMFVALSMMAVLILPALVVGFLISFVQALTQINDISLNAIPKVFVTFFCLIIFGPWLLKTITAFSETLINDIPYLIG